MFTQRYVPECHSSTTWDGQKWKQLKAPAIAEQAKGEKKIVAYSHIGILHSSGNKWDTLTHNTDGSDKHNLKQEKPVTKKGILYIKMGTINLCCWKSGWGFPGRGWKGSQETSWGLAVFCFLIRMLVTRGHSSGENLSGCTLVWSIFATKTKSLKKFHLPFQPRAYPSLTTQVCSLISILFSPFCTHLGPSGCVQLGLSLLPTCEPPEGRCWICRLHDLPLHPTHATT